jgi:hypothetical protein
LFRTPLAAATGTRKYVTGQRLNRHDAALIRAFKVIE